MPVAAKTERTCPECEYSGDVWAFEKQTGETRKECYTCPACGDEWAVAAN